MPFKFNSQKFCWKLKIKSLTTTKISFNSTYFKSAIKSWHRVHLIALLRKALLKPQTLGQYNSVFGENAIKAVNTNQYYSTFMKNAIKANTV
jgi:hypothetical protein